MRTEFKNRQGHMLIGDLDSGSDTLIIACHGLAGNRNHQTIKRIAQELHAKGFSVLRFDFSGHGESAGPSTISLKQQVDDTCAALKAYQKYKKIFLLGTSISACSAAIVAQSESITGLITVNGGFYPRYVSVKHQLMLCALLLRPQGWREWQYYRESFLPQQINVPTLVIHGTIDTRVLPKQSELFAKNVRSSKLVLLPGANHSFDQKGNIDACVSAITTWLRNL